MCGGRRYGFYQSASSLSSLHLAARYYSGRNLVAWFICDLVDWIVRWRMMEMKECRHACLAEAVQAAAAESKDGLV
jgi:hypothetical protein